MEYIIIGTTAINRSNLHEQTLKVWKDWILKSNKKIIWFINIDKLDHLDETYEETKTKLNTILNLHELIILPQQFDGFTGACKKLSQAIKEHVDQNNLSKNCVIMWLEDDWQLDNQIELIKLLEYSGNMTHINLSFIENNYIWALAPSIISYKLWEEIFYTSWLLNDKKICPEKIVGCYYQTKYSVRNMMNITLINKNIDVESKLIKFRRSYYGYTDDKYFIENLMNHAKYLSNNQVLNVIQDTSPIFIRIYPEITTDVGTKYLENNKIKKIFDKQAQISYIKID